MKLTKYLLPVLVLVAELISIQAFAQIEDRLENDRPGRERSREQETSFEFRKDEQNTRTSREFIESKEPIDVKEKASNLQISGDVRFEWNHYNEWGKRIFAKDERDLVQKYKWLRGGHRVIDNNLLPISANDWDVDCNLKFGYTYGRAWANLHLQFDNPAGVRGYKDCRQNIQVLTLNDHGSFTSTPDFNLGSLSNSSYYDYDYFSPESGSDESVTVVRDLRESCKGSGQGDAINLKRAYMGYTIWVDGQRRLDIELGRRKLNDIFDSDIQYSSRFDGVILKYSDAINEVMDWYWYGSVFVIDERIDHYGFITEVGLLDILGSGLDLRYSYIDWTKRGRNRCFRRHSIGSEFRNSQFAFDYRINPEILRKQIPFDFYGAFIINHAARETVFTRDKRGGNVGKKNLGWYLGVVVGELEKAGDLAIDLSYEYVQAQMTSDCDVDGIGRGNTLDERFTDIVIIRKFNECGDLREELLFPRRGNTNFKGWSLVASYALTDNLTLQGIYQFSHAEDSKLGGRHFYRDIEVEAIYAF